MSRGSKFPTRFISTTRDINVALREFRRTGNRIVAIDLGGIPAGRIIDLSSEAARAAAGLRGPFATNFARASAEILIEFEVPSKAVLPFVPLPGITP